MSLVDSLLGAIIRLEGDSLVLHTGEKPYVVTSSSAMSAFRGPLAWGQVELSTKALTPGAVMSVVEQLVDREHLRALDEMGAVETLLPEQPDRPAFQIVAARGGDDIWVEIRPVRPKVEVPAEPAVEHPAEPPPPARPPEAEAGAHIEIVPEVQQEQPDAAAVAALVASSGLAPEKLAGAASAPGPAPETAPLTEEERRIAAAREEVERLEARTREEAARLASLREESAQLDRLREEATRAADAAREAAARTEADARAAVEALEQKARHESARLQTLRDELAALEQTRQAAERAEASRVEALCAEAALAEATTREEQARVEALRAEALRLERARAEAARVEAATREEAARLEALRAEAARLEGARLDAQRAAALARDEAQRVETLRQEAAGLEAAREEARRAEALVREEAGRVEALRREAGRLDAAREEAARTEALAREEAARVEALREEGARLEAAREEAKRAEALAHEEAARVEALRQEVSRLDAAREEVARTEALAREEAARVEALREEAARLEAARAEAVRFGAEAREQATRQEAAAREQEARVAEANTALELAQREIAGLRDAIRHEAQRLESMRSTIADVEQARLRAEREERERVAAARAAEHRERARLEDLRAQAEKAEAARREHEAALHAARSDAQSAERVARRDGEERLQALVAALRDESVSRARSQVERPAPQLQDTVTAAAPREEARPAPLEPEAPREQPAAVSVEPAEVQAVTGEPPRPSERVAPAARTVEEDQGVGALEPPAPPELVQAEEPRPALVLPLVRGMREQPPAAPSSAAAPDLDRLLRIAAARGASGLYLVSRSHPAVRVDGDMQTLDGEEPLAAADIEAFTLGLVPEPNRDSVRSGATIEWFCEVPEIGRVRCLSFRDHRGPGVIIRMLPARSVSAEQLGLSRDVRALSMQPDGLVLVAGPRASGKSMMLAAFVDLINRTRADHLIMIERQITFLHQSQRAFVSQREVRGEAHEVLAAVRTALREDPDVLVVEELRSPEVVAALLESAESGRLVLAGLRAPAAAQAIERLMNQVTADQRADALSSLSTSLRGVVSQVLLRKRGGGRIAARELLLNTPGVAAVLAEGKLFQLGAALESGRKLGSVPLNDSLVALIRDGIVDPGEAWRKAYDREGLLTLLKREGIDTSFVERLA